MGMLLDLFRNKWPYTDFHELNADWIISTVRQLIETMDAFVQNESITFADPITWNITTQYAKATVVIDSTGNAYLSKQAVPSGIQLNNGEYWQEIFDFTTYTRTANRNLTFNVETDTTRATAAYSVDDWLILNDVLYKVTQPIAIDDTFIIAPAAGSNIVHFTVEDFIKAFITYATNLINQYKNEIDASELAYRQQLAQDIATTTASLQAQLDAAIAGATVDSEVINARVGYDNTTYATLRDAIVGQVSDIHSILDNIFEDITDQAVAGDWNTGGTTYLSTLSHTTYPNCAALEIAVNKYDVFFITGSCTSGGRKYYILDSSDKVLRWYDGPTALSTSKLIVDVDGAAKVVIQTNNVTSFKIVKSTLYMEKLREVEGIFTPNDYTEEVVIQRWYTGTNWGQAPTETTDATGRSANLSVSPFDVFKITCKGGSAGRAYYILDSNGDIIGIAPSGSTFTNEYVVMPEGAANFIVQTNSSSYWKIEKVIDLESLYRFYIAAAGFYTDTPISGGVVGQYFTASALYRQISQSTYAPCISCKISVKPYERYKISGQAGGSGRSCFILDKFDRVLFMTPGNTTISNYEVVIPENGAYLIAQSISQAAYSFYKVASSKYEANIEGCYKDSFMQFNRQAFTSASKLLNAELSHYETNKINVAFIGDSWVQGTPDNIESGKYTSYVKPLSHALFDKYGFGGLGWLDFGRDGGTGTMFGCIDMYDHWSYAFSGTVTGVDGSADDASAAASLGICCAHTEFATGATLHLTFNAGYLDQFKIKYYKDAHFTVSINNGSPVEITANSSDGWQSTTIGTIGVDTIDVLITALDDSIIFGMDCNYGNYGIKCHKIGNRSLKLERYLMMDQAQFETAYADLDCCWCSILFAINDLGSGADYEGITQNYISFIDWINASNNYSSDINIIGCAAIPSTTFAHLPELEQYLCDFALSRSYGWASSRNCIGAKSNLFARMGVFNTDNIHLNKYGSRILGDYVFKELFDVII